MDERLRSESLQVREVRMGEPFRPFESASYLSTENLDKLDTQYIDVLVTPITLQQVPGCVKATAIPLKDFQVSFTTPLGQANLTETFEDDKRRVAEAPLALVVVFKLKSREEYKRLYDIAIKINFGNGVIGYTHASGDFDLSEQRQTVEFDSQDPNLEVFNDDIVVNGEEFGTCLLPFDLQKLRQIEIEFIEKSQAPKLPDVTSW